MGQNTSLNTDPLPKSITCIQEELLRQTRQISEVASCNYEEFSNSLKELNELCKFVVTHSGKRLLFAVKKGSDDTLLWRATIRIFVIQFNEDSNEVEQYRVLTLPQFLRVSNTIKSQLLAPLSQLSNAEAQPLDSSSSSSTSISEPGPLRKDKELTYSMFLDNVDEALSKNLVECCICLERQPDIILPCTHAFCLTCIERWKEVHKSCPICREKFKSTDDAWVLSDIPGSEDISQEICAALMSLSCNPDTTKH